MKRIIHKVLGSLTVGAGIISLMFTNPTSIALSISYIGLLLYPRPAAAEALPVTSTEPFLTASFVEQTIERLQQIQDSLRDWEILNEAKDLSSSSYSRPYWQSSPFNWGEQVPSSSVPDVIAHLMTCENLSRLRNPSSTAKIIDSNGLYSYGILQFQKATWVKWSKASGIVGDPEDTHDSIRMATWAIENGKLDAWTCASILGIIE